MQPDPASGRGGDRGTLARLRRCASVAELMLEPATIILFRRCKAEPRATCRRSRSPPACWRMCARDDPAQTVARLVGPEAPEKPETALLKPLRFRALMEARTDDERLIAFRRLVALADRTLNVADLADALLHWTEERASAAGCSPTGTPTR